MIKNNYLLQYKTVDQLMAEVLMSFKTYDANGMIDTSELLGEVRRINKSLGNKLRQNKEAMLYVEHGKVRLPLDFHILNLAIGCYDFTVTQRVIVGDQRDYRLTETVVPVAGCAPTCPEVVQPCVRLTSCGQSYEIVETKAYETYNYTSFGKIHIKPGNSVYQNCINTRFSCEQTAYIKNGFLYTNFDEGKVYIDYIGAMEDEEGNLLVLDHELINPYYEYALKRRILENFYIDGEDVAQKLNLIELRYKESKVVAETLVNTWELSEMKTAHDSNRAAMYQKYYYIFK
jgi:hypothetical protein